jgi:hypothetical protein
MAAMMQADNAPVQPIPYSHKQHLALGLKCANCHDMPNPGEVINIPEAAKCMACHQSVKTDSPAIQKLAAFAKEKRAIPWVRVYEIPGFVSFSHKVHLDSGASCEKCHGPVAQRERLWKETDISMGGCMECHRVNKATIDCAGCHDLKN